MGVADEAVLDLHGMDALIARLGDGGRVTMGPVVRDGAVVLAPVSGVADLPAGWHDRQEPGRYRLEPGPGPELFGWAVGPSSPKPTVFPPEETVWRARGGARAEAGAVSVAGAVPVALAEPAVAAPPVALIGVRPCDVAALGVLGRVLGSGPVPDGRFAARRRAVFVVAVECGSPASTCFCASMGSGPGLPDQSTADLVLTELLDGGHRFYARAGTPDGAEVLGSLPRRSARPADRTARQAVLDRAGAQMGRALDTRGLAADLAGAVQHPQWDEVAERCLSCGNCTLVCPTCFCSDVADTTDLSGTVARRRRWASCFDPAHSYVNGGPVRSTTSSRYRQWLTHKLGTWWDQFGQSGCVGCGRCVTWCPVGIDLTREVAAVRSVAAGGDPAATSGVSLLGSR